MSAKCPLITAVSVFLFASLIGCSPRAVTDSSASDFFVNSSGLGGVSGYLPTGWGWTPGSDVEISIFNEPDGPGSASTQWKKILNEKVDGNSLFGFQSNPPFYPVRRNICGFPENGQKLVFMAKNVTTGRIQLRQVSADLYFTFQRCA